MERTEDLADIRAMIDALPTDKWALSEFQLDNVFAAIATAGTLTKRDRIFLMSEIAKGIDVVSIALIHLYNIYCDEAGDDGYRQSRI